MSQLLVHFSVLKNVEFIPKLSRFQNSGHSEHNLRVFLHLFLPEGHQKLLELQFIFMFICLAQMFSSLIFLCAVALLSM